MPRIVLDLGGCFVRAGVVPEADASGAAGDGNRLKRAACASDPQLTVPNMSAKVKGSRAAVIADEVSSVPDVSSLVIRRPFDKGYLVNADLESQILDRVFRDKALGVGTTKGASLLCTEAIFALPAVQHTLNELVFEKYGFEKLLAVPAPYLTANACAFGDALGSIRETIRCTGPACTIANTLDTARQAKCGVVLDAGFSFSYVFIPSRGRLITAPHLTEVVCRCCPLLQRVGRSRRHRLCSLCCALRLSSYHHRSYEQARGAIC